MTIQERTRPKGFNKKVWLALYAEAEANKAWALDIIKNNPEWCRNASTASIEMLGAYLHLQPWALAESAYQYLEMRAHGETFIGAICPSSRRRWVELTGKNVSKAKRWHYDHNTHTTSATKKDGKWVDRSGNEIRVK